MQKIKENKVQILAAFALALSLGLVVPSVAVFAEEDATATAEETGAENEISAEDGAKVVEADVTSPDLLNDLVAATIRDADYVKYNTLFTALAAFPATGDPTAAQLKAAQDAVKAIDSSIADSEIDTANKVKTVASSLAGYEGWNAVINAITTVTTKTGVAADKVTSALISSKMTEAEIKTAAGTILKYLSASTENVAESTNLVYNRVESWTTFKEYRDARTLVTRVINSEYLFETAEKFLNDRSPSFDKPSFWNGLSDASKAKLSGKYGYEAYPIIAELPEYKSDTTFKDFVDGQYKSGLDSCVNALREELPKVMPSVTGADKMNIVELVTEARKLKNFDKYYDLYLASIPVASEAVENGAFVLANFKALDAEKQMKLYADYASAAAAIDPYVTFGLAGYKVSSSDTDASKSPTAPNSGLLGLFENGVLDLGTLTLIVSVAVASIAGAGLIAKLYLKHKF